MKQIFLGKSKLNILGFWTVGWTKLTALTVLKPSSKICLNKFKGVNFRILWFSISLYLKGQINNNLNKVMIWRSQLFAVRMLMNWCVMFLLSRFSVLFSVSGSAGLLGCRSGYHQPNEMKRTRRNNLLIWGTHFPQIHFASTARFLKWFSHINSMDDNCIFFYSILIIIIIIIFTDFYIFVALCRPQMIHTSCS